MRIRPLLLSVLLLVAASAHAQLESDPAYGLSSHFRTWLSANGYSSYAFQRTDVPGGSYGGRVSAGQAVVNHPVIFIHGNSDSALGTGSSLATGWRASIEYFKAQGYTSAELYATTWGPANSAFSSQQYHSKEYLTRIRAFIQAVKAYTGATKVDIVTHSMGVTLARKAIKGGSGNDSLAGGAYNLGASLTSSVDTFVGIAGANRGLTMCYVSGPTTPTCGSTNGFYPGYLVGGFGPYGVSSFLVDLAATSHYEGTYVYTIWSSADEVIGYGTMVYGQSTCRIPAQNGEKTFSGYPYGHIGSKDQTAYWQWRMVKDHATN
ncbi:MAG TPA: lipase family protein [Thermoanaerobaculia bacterium]|jgi:triacylglycerol lipase|nr:lipase family protein [Thermoanaerobaculia bacterium]